MHNEQNTVYHENERHVQRIHIRLDTILLILQGRVSVKIVALCRVMASFLAHLSRRLIGEL